MPHSAEIVSSYIRRNGCALSPKLDALYSITSSLILITCDTFEYGCTMPYCRKLTALFPNYVHCFQNWPEKGVILSTWKLKNCQYLLHVTYFFVAFIYDYPVSDLYLTGYLTSPLLPESIFCALLVLMGFEVNELPSVLPNVVQYWRCTYIQSKYAPILFGQAEKLSSKLHEHCLVRLALCRIWNVCRNAALHRNFIFIRRIRCALSPKLYALYSITSSLILITCDTFEYGRTMPYCQKLTTLFPNYVHCFQNWPEKGVHQKIARSMEIYWHLLQILSPVRGVHDVTCSKCLPFWATHSAARRLASSVKRVGMYSDFTIYVPRVHIPDARWLDGRVKWTRLQRGGPISEAGRSRSSGGWGRRAEGGGEPVSWWAGVEGRAFGRGGPRWGCGVPASRLVRTGHFGEAWCRAVR